MFFEAYLLNSYNHQIATRLLVDCPKCYKNYEDETTFKTYVIDGKRSYFGCIPYESHTTNRIGHRSVPIMLGSIIDWHIRGEKAVMKSRSHWGTFIQKGMSKIYTSFSTFDALSTHVRQTKFMKTIELFTYVSDSGLEVCYNNHTVQWKYQQETRNNKEHGDQWIYLLNQATPFVLDRPILSYEYIRLFDVMLSYNYDMNDLKNRQFLNGATIMSKYIKYDLSRRKTKRGVGCVKMSEAFERGSLFIVLSKKNNTESEDWSKNFAQRYDNTLHEGRSNKAAHFLPTVTRAANDAIRNSRALTYPRDAFYFLCPLNSKDLKFAGEQNVLADYVMMTEDFDPSPMYDYMKMCEAEQRARNDSPSIPSTSCESSTTNAIIIINGFLIDCSIEWSFEFFKTLKQKFPHVTTKYYMPYVFLSSKSCIPIKYSEEHDIFFSAAETTQYNVTFDETLILSYTASQLNLTGLRKTPPAKSTVAINNIKGSVANRVSDFHEALTKMSLGITCIFHITDEERERITRMSTLKPTGSCDTTNFERTWRLLDEKYNLTQQMVNAEKQRIDGETNRAKAMRNLVTKMYDQSKLLMQYRTTVGAPYEYARSRDVSTVQTYVNRVFSSESFDTPPVWNIKLWVMFGNVNGFCVEDGIVLDSKTVSIIPPIVYSACITVDFTFDTMKQPANASFVRINDNTSREDDTLVGCLITEHLVYLKNSKHCKIYVARIGNHYYYLLHFLPKSNNTYQNLHVRHIINGKVLTVIITGTHNARVGVGTKVANSDGQKNVCSHITDLSGYYGVTRDGRKVHAQLIYHDISLVSRTPAGQLFKILTSKDLAIGPNGELLAPESLVIHSLHPFTNDKKFDIIKLDTLTKDNGCDSQNLAYFITCVRREKIINIVRRVIGLHGYVVVDASSLEEAETFDEFENNQRKAGNVVDGRAGLHVGKSQKRHYEREHDRTRANGVARADHDESRDGDSTAPKRRRR